ncbi:non-ribosomal peptide synthetase [Pseudoalteromonas ostreae]|uniref:non-ribosomal peptide synthetase n=1 Tax=Pseudoalteromonas ostreae TaxID=2774154 RepID=UPI001B37809D|nr:non-ribosomal peptide synthetase [Pseudoalteromonas ostreae]
MTAITIMDYLYVHVEQQSEQCALICVDRKNKITYSYKALYAQSLLVASHIAPLVAAKERVLILMDTGIDYVTSFLACQYLGVTAIPSFAPESTKAQHIARTVGIAEDSQATLVLTSRRFADTVSIMCEQLTNSQMLVIDELNDCYETPARYDAKPNDIAFLQYTSGSTAKPKGVMISHGNLIANERVISQKMQTTENDIMVSWLPLFHDMGLIGGLLQPLFVGFPLVLASPRYFMERPARWLQLISDYKGTISGGPDFSFRLCLDRIKAAQLSQFDLSHWRVAYSGAEPIRHDTLLEFADKFAGSGFKESAIYPCYGLAEGTLMVTGSEAFKGAYIRAFDNNQLAKGKAKSVRAKDSRNTDSYSHQVGCGLVGADHTLRISCPTTFAAKAAGEIGEIWCAGPSIALGYWQNEVATVETFVELDGKRWLRTGDVGYIYNEQLFISGRQKDLIIINGHNLYPQDLERSIEAQLSFVRQGRVSAFPIPSKESGEGIGLAIETSNQYRNQTPATQTAIIIRDFILSEFGHCPELIILLDQGGLPKTSSGKLQRSACLKLYTANKLAVYGGFSREELQQLILQNSTDHTQWNKFENDMAALWQAVLHYPVRGDQDDFFALGGSSIKAVQLLTKVQKKFNCYLDTTSIFSAHRFVDFCVLVKQVQTKKNTSIIIEKQDLVEAPLSAQQLRQVFLWQLQPHSNANHIGAQLTLNGVVNKDALQVACQQVLNEQAILRQRYFKNNHGQWRQSTVTQTLDWQFADLRAQKENEQESAAWIADFSRQTFALDQGENFRIGLIRSADKRYTWLLSMHHIASDAWTFELLIEAISKYYHCLCLGQPLPTNQPEISYSDYAAWQQDWLLSEQASAQLAYWQAQLQGAGDEVLLAPQHHRQLDVVPLATTMLTVNYQQVQSLQAVAHQQHASLFMLLLSSLQVLFYRIAGRAKPRIAIATANRQNAQVQSLAGFFINTQVITADISPQQSFESVLDVCKEKVMMAQENQDYPFEKLVEILNPERLLGQTPLFQVMFNHVEYDFNGLASLPELTCAQIQSLPHEAQFDFSVDSRLFADGELALELQYNSALFDSDYVAKIKACWHTLLTQIIQQPQLAIGNLVPTQNTKQWLQLGQGKCSQLPKTNWLTSVSQHAPDSTAIIYQNTHYSYGWLEQTANCLARGLIASELGCNPVVGVMLPRTPIMLACILACIKARVAYLPLDMSLPKQKLQHMLQDSACQGIFADQSQDITDFSGAWLLPNTLLGKPHQGTDVPFVFSHVEQVAYLNYTSGSTGQAKGVAISHGALALYIESAKEFIGLSKEDVVLQFATANFDAFVEQLFPTWAIGASIVLRDDNLWDAQTLYQQALQHNISVMDLSAAYWRSIAASWAKQHTPIVLPHLRQVHSGGEAMSVNGIADWHAAGLGHVRLLNTYGPTEIVVEAAIYDCQSLAANRSVPLGTPLQGRRLYVLDDNLTLVDENQIGELYVGGDILAREYCHQPVQTAQRFIADPFIDSGARMYATGDLVRWQGGQLHYVGRRDHQVKIRGFRVELSEIEQHLCQLSHVNTAVVVTQDAKHGLELIAYVESSAEQSLTSANLKRALIEQLPHYMIPKHLVIVPKLQVNNNGKLDRHNLPAIADTATDAPIEIASNEIEQLISLAWQQHLKLGLIDRQANFFDVGGHSLLLMAVHETLQSHFPKLQLTELFTYPSVASLAAYLSGCAVGDLSAPNTPSADKQKRGMNALAARRKKARES